MKTETPETESARVPETATQAEETIRSRWPWVEPTVWTDRMLTALENGVKGEVWFSLIDNQRWPNRYFRDAGYFSLAEAHRLACQSRRGTH